MKFGDVKFNARVHGERSTHGGRRPSGRSVHDDVRKVHVVNNRMSSSRRRRTVTDDTLRRLLMIMPILVVLHDKAETAIVFKVGDGPGGASPRRCGKRWWPRRRKKRVATGGSRALIDAIRGRHDDRKSGGLRSFIVRDGYNRPRVGVHFARGAIRFKSASAH
mgnify:CR=1 FL=1